jgi:hypothetical protein
VPIDRLELRDTARRIVDVTRTRPVTNGLSAALGVVLDDPKSKLWQAIEPAWKGRYFQSPSSALALVHAAIHYDALLGTERAAALAGKFLTCGGMPGPGIKEAAVEYLAEPTPTLQAALKERVLRQYNPFIAWQWMNFADIYFQKRGMNYHVVEFNSPGGLGACADALEGPKGFNSGLIEARLALDEPMLDITKDADAQWLVACFMPEDMAQISQLARATANLRDCLKRDKDFLQTAACPSHLGSAFVAKNIPVEEDTGLMIFSVRLNSEMPHEHRKSWSDSNIELMKAWQGRALWVQFENKPGVDGAIFLYRWKDGKLASYEAMRFFGNGSDAKILADLEAIGAFLA